jgi:hypothetical protein
VGQANYKQTKHRKHRKLQFDHNKDTPNKSY